MSEMAGGKNGNRAAEETCIDGLLWIGQTYSGFFCGRSESCVDPERPQGPHCFVHEADRRGVSRRVPQVPSWAVPGESRIFLAHRGGEQMPWRGRIFGYFVLDRVEVVATSDSLTGSDGHKGKPTRPSLKGKPVNPQRKGKPGEPEPDPEGSKFRAKECWNGKVIVTHLYDPRRKEWVPTDEKCPKFPEPPQDEDESEDDGLVFLPDDNEMLAEHRGCSLRANPGAVYLVDGLAAEITDAFAARLDQGSIRKRADKQAAKRLFNELVDQIAPAHAPTAKVPRRLRGKAHARGELILFDDPPLFEQRPQASFRALAHIDGEQLLEQIAKGVAKPEIHSCRKRARVATSREVITVVAERAHANKQFARELLTELSDLAHEELDEYEEFRVPGMGTLKKSRDGLVRFLPYKAARSKPR